MQILSYDRHGLPAKCGVSTGTIDGKTVIVLTELPDNTGMSITNSYERVANMVKDVVDTHPLEIVWYEHYKRESGRDDVDLVAMSWTPSRGYYNAGWAPAMPETHADVLNIVEQVGLGEITPKGIVKAN